VRRDEFAYVVDVEDLDVNVMKEDTLYAIREGWRGRNAVAFLCPCGCGGFHCIAVYASNESIPDFCAWEIQREGDKITLSPSLLNGCGAHFFIQENKIIWCN